MTDRLRGMTMIRINDFKLKATAKAAILVSGFLLFTVVMGFGQQVVNLTAGPTGITLPDGNGVPMWGYACGAVVTSTATCAPLSGPTSPAAVGALGSVAVINGGSGYTSVPTVGFTGGGGTGAAAVAAVANGQVVSITLTTPGSGYTSAPTVTLTGGGGTGVAATAGPAWSPIVITVPTGAAGGLQINLTNNLTFTPQTAGATVNNIPTSIMIVGQVGGGLGNVALRTTTTSPDHSNAQGTYTWPIAGGAGSGTPPVQGARVQSFAAEVAPVAATTTATCTAPSSGTVTGCASLTWPYLKPGTYLLESATHPSIQVPMGLIGMLVVTTAPVPGTAGTAYPAVGTVVPAVQYNAEIPLEFSEIDPVQNNNVNIAVNTNGFSETRVWSGLNATVSPGVPSATGVGCGNPSSPLYHTCYPPAVNYTPFYYLINGVAFNKTNTVASQFPVSQGTATSTVAGTVLARLVNAGLKMHVPSIVGAQTTGWNGGGTASTTVNGFTLIAEDGNPVPGPLTTGPAPRVQTDVFMAAGKTFDVMINAACTAVGTTTCPATATSLPVYDRELSLSANSSERDAGMLAYISINGAGLPTFGTGIAGTAVARNDTYNSVVGCTAAPCTPVVVSDASKGVIANDSFVYGVELSTGPTGGTLTCGATPGNPVPGLCANGTFTYTPNPGTTTDSFTYIGNGNPIVTATVTLGAAGADTAGITMSGITYNAKAAGYINIAPPGPLSVDKDNLGYPLSVVTNPAPTAGSCTSLTIQPNGGFIATAPALAGNCQFTYAAKNTQGVTGTATVTINFPTPSNLQVKVLDAVQYKACQGDSTCISALTPINDYRWLIEEDKTFYVNPVCTTNSSTPIAGCPQPVSTGPNSTTVPPTFGAQFHTSHMDYIAQGCTGSGATDQSCEQGQTVLGVPSVCEVGNGVCIPGTAQPAVLPGQVALDPGCGFGTFPGRTCGTGVAAPYPKRYYISVFPGDAANTFAAGYAGSPTGCTPVSGGTSTCGHGMGGAPISWNTATNSWNPVIALSEPNPYPPGKLSVQVFEDDFPLNGEQDSGGGIDVIATNEPGLGGFEIILWDVRAQFGDTTGQMTHDFFNQPLSNSLAGTIDPATGLDACPISSEITQNSVNGGKNIDPVNNPQGSLQGLTGRIVTCPKYESDGTTMSPLAGEAVVANLMPMQLTVQAYPGADRIARGEEWLQTNTLDGQHPHDAFVKIGEPAYFQEYGPAGFHVSIGFANPAIINTRYAGVCNGTDLNLTATNCTNSVTGKITTERLSRPPDERLYSSGSRDAYYWTQCWVSLGDPDGEDFMFTKCDANGNFTLKGVPTGDWRLTIGDQWNDQIIDGLSTPLGVGTAANQSINMGDIPTQQWQSNLMTRTFIDDNKNGVYDSGEVGIPFLNTAVYYRDGSRSNLSLTDFTGTAPFNETFPLFNWYVVEPDTTRYKLTGIHTVYDVGGPTDGSASCGAGGTGNPKCGPSGTPYAFYSNTYENLPLPASLSVPGAVYCATADCSGSSISTSSPNSQGTSSGRIDPPWASAEGWQGHIGQFNWIEFGMTPYAPTENGGIKGHVIYTSTRAFDDPAASVQQPWMPLVPHVTMNLYQEGFAADGVTPTLTLVDTTQTSSWDDWAQGFRSDGVPNVNCPGQGAATGTNADLFFYTLYNQPNYLNLYDYYYNGATLTPLPNNSQYKCYDGMHNWNQLQPAPHDGAYQFPSVLGIIPNGTNAGKLNTALHGGVPGGANGTLVPAPMGGTNCTICITNPDTTDPWRVGTPMLPPGKYVVEVVPPPGYELVKEEDKNILIGDSFIAPVDQQFGGLGNIFILPDQASVASMYDPSGSGSNANNQQNPTQSFGQSAANNFVPGFLEPTPKCVGQARIVPDFMSIFPGAQEVAAFAGATRNLCDRKEVILPNEMAATAKFYIFTSTHIAAKYTGIITDDFTSEFDPFAPTFGEKFSPPNQPISTRDWNGLEISRVYSDQWGAFNGLTYSTWDVNPPNPTGYAPAMFVQCMNDAGPAIDFRPTIVNSAGVTVPNPSYGQQVAQDPLFNPLYSQFCYENPYLPGVTAYLDTPVVPTAGFVGAGYNNPDCAYPTMTPAVAEVDGDGVGPWVSQPGHNITITALGDQLVNNYGYSGPQATTSPFNQQTVTRHYGFGSQCTSPTAGNATCNMLSTVTIGGANATIVSWSDTQIVATVPGNVPQCAVQQQVQYGNPNTTGAPGQTTRCGELLITAGNGQQSIDSVTVTVSGKTPTHVPASGSIQAAIDAAAPGDLIIVDPTCNAAAGPTSCTAAGVTSKTPYTHRELLIMWKPVRLQGVGAASSIIDASTHPAGELKLDPWRRSVNCLFGLAMNGQPSTGSAGSNPFDNPSDNSGQPFTCPNPSSPTASGMGPNGNTWNYFYGGPNYPQLVVDRIPLEGILGWDATVNGNLAEQLQEPSIMGAYEGSAITVVAKGVRIPAGASDVYGSGAEAGFPAGSTLLTGVVGANGGSLLGDNNPLCHTSTGRNGNAANPYPSNFMCNPSSIDGLGITDSSQGGGGLFLHAWTHNLQIANNRIYNNAGTLSGGMTIGQGEFPEAYLAPNSSVTIAPGSCQDSAITNTQLPYCQQLNVNMHNNMIVDNSSTGDELFTGTPAGAGGASICTGSDYYKFNYNWICGNMSTGDGGGVGHLGFSYNGDIEHNSFLFNQSINPTIQSNGGGLIIMGAAPDGTTLVNGVATECGSVTDNDCVPGLSDGVGPGLVINANLFEGNGAEAGSGGGLRLQGVNGADVARFPANPERWYQVLVTNNIIDNNVAGWDGAGVSLEDALAVTLTNNTISSNDTTASSGALFNTLGAPLASSQSPAPTCLSNAGGTVSCPQPAGLVSMQNSPQLTSSFTTGAIHCPAGNYAPGTSATNGTCIHISYPALYNNIFWQNRSFQIGVGPLGSGAQNQQNVVSLYNAAFGGGLGSTPAPQASTGACPSGSSYWDLGVRDDTGPTNHSSGYTLNPLEGVLTSTTGYNNTNLSSNPAFISQYCNGSRVPPENGGLGYNVPAGISDSVVPNPIFSLTPTATVDEGNNWVNMSWGPLSMLNPVTSTGATNVVLGSYSLLSGSPDVDHLTCSSLNGQGQCVETLTPAVSGVTAIRAPALDFFGNPRPDPGNPNHIDVGAVEFQGAGGGVAAPTLTSIAPTQGYRANAVNITLTGTNLTTTNTINVSGTGVTVSNLAVVNDSTVTATFTIAVNATLSTRIVTVTTAYPTSPSNAVTFTVLAPSLTSISPNTGVRGTTVPVAITGNGLAGATAVNVSGTGVTCTITGTPTATTVNASCVITAAAGTTARTVTVSTPGGTANGTPNPVTFQVLSATVAFSGPTPAMNAGGTSTKTATITVSNTATGPTAGPLTLTAAPTIARVSGTGNGTFSITGGTCASGTVVNPGGSCTINVQYSGQTNTSTANGRVTLTDTGAGTAAQSSPTFPAN